ncbi:ABC transporter substrate-binding protein [Enterococcus gilvus]|uniref:ABC transporter substrate-binding protein n=1 Tax=Enterococcus gilvus TaxID=160453 RepID=UPI003ED8C749
MKIKSILALAIPVVSILCLGACGSKNISSKSSDTSDVENKRIIVTSPCPATTFYAYKEGRQGIVGISDWLFSNGNKKILNSIIPSTKKVNTSFINSDFKINLESLMNLKPDYIFYYAKYQNDGLERAKVPTVDLAGKDQDPKKLQILWEKRFCNKLNIKNEHKYEKAWNHTQKEIDANKGNAHLKVLYINRLNKQIVVSAPNTTQDYYLKYAGLENVATDLGVKGDQGRFVNVSLEQVYKWDPDMIIVNFGSAKQILSNKIDGQDWSKLKAVKNKKVYSSPVGLHTWGNLGGDSPLMPLWLLNLSNPTKMTDQRLKSETKKYYKKMFDYDLSEKMINSILESR